MLFVLNEALPMSTHNAGFLRDINKNVNLITLSIKGYCELISCIASPIRDIFQPKKKMKKIFSFLQPYPP